MPDNIALQNAQFELSTLRTDLDRLKERLAKQDTEIEALKAAIKIMLASLGRKELEERKNGR